MQNACDHLLMMFWQLAQQPDHVHQCSPVCAFCKGCWKLLQHQLQDAQHCHNMLACSSDQGQPASHGYK